MNNEQWHRLVESVLTNVEPDEQRRSMICRRLREHSATGMLYSAWVSGGDPTWIGRILAALARKER